MKLKINYEKLKKIKWYRQGGAMHLFYVAIPLLSMNKALGHDRCISYQKGVVGSQFFDSLEERKRALFVIKKIKKDKKYIDAWIKDWEKRVVILERFLKKSFKNKIENWDDKDLYKFLVNYKEICLKTWLKGILIEYFDPEGLDILKREIKRAKINLEQKDLEILLSPEKPTFMQEELLMRANILKKIKRGRDIKKDIKNHAKKFYWYKDNWAYVHNLNVQYFENKIKKELSIYTEIIKDAENTKIFFKSIKKRKEIIFKKNRVSPELKNVFYLFSKMIDWRDERKRRTCCMPNVYLYQIMERLKRENNMSEEMLGCFMFDEIEAWKIKGKILNQIKKRMEKSILLYTEKFEPRWLYGKESEKLYEVLIKTISSSEIKGVVANAGIIRGKVKIIETREDFSKFKKGDILVATMTRPEYLPLIKIAGAIVTNEGGITCHAAIVSREFGKPCIIGTQTASEKLKDDQLVEVDANKGVVKILK